MVKTEIGYIIVNVALLLLGFLFAVRVFNATVELLNKHADQRAIESARSYELKKHEFNTSLSQGCYYLALEYKIDEQECLSKYFLKEHPEQ